MKNKLNYILIFIVEIFLIIYTLELFNKINPTAETAEGMNFILYIITFIPTSLVAYYITIFIHELGHLIAGILSHYHFVYFRIFKWTLMKKNGHFEIKYYHILGTYGQCIMAPTLPFNKQPYKLFHTGGIIANLCMIPLSVFMVYWLKPQPYFLNSFFFLFIVMSGISVLLNGLPLRNGFIGNDGYHLHVYRKNKDALETVYRQLIIQSKLCAGLTYQDIFIDELPHLADNQEVFHNYLIVKLSLLAFYQAHKNEQKVQEILDDLKQRYEPDKGFYYPYFVELIFYALKEGSIEEANKLWNSESFQKSLKLHHSLPHAKRIQMAYAYYYEHDTDKAKAIYDRLYQTHDQYAIIGEMDLELQLMQGILQNIEKPEI